MWFTELKRMLKWFGHVERMFSVADKENMSEVGKKGDQIGDGRMEREILC